MYTYARKFGLWYNSMINAYPRITKTATATMIAATADISAQYLHHQTMDRTLLPDRSVTEKFTTSSSSSSYMARSTTSTTLSTPFTINWQRTGKVILFTTFITPVIHHWYLFLFTRFRRPLLRMVYDQLLWAPIGTTLFIVTVNREPIESPVTHQRILQGIKANWLVWPLMQYLNFQYVPLAYNILFVNVVSYFWTVYLSGLANDPLMDNDSGEYPSSIVKSIPDYRISHAAEAQHSDRSVYFDQSLDNIIIENKYGHQHTLSGKHMRTPPYLTHTEDIDGFVHSQETFGIEPSPDTTNEDDSQSSSLVPSGLVDTIGHPSPVMKIPLTHAVIPSVTAHTMGEPSLHVPPVRPISIEPSLSPMTAASSPVVKPSHEKVKKTKETKKVPKLDDKAPEPFNGHE